MQRPWHTHTIGILAVTQIISWGSLYYAFGVLAPAIGRDLALSPEVLYGAFSASILVAGLSATPVGIAIDRIGGRWMMATGSLACGLGLFWLAGSHGAASFIGAWLVLGVGMSLSLYEAAFATIMRRSAEGARRAISTLTLFGGFASTIFWPLTAQFQDSLGWRQTYFCFAILQLMVCLPLHVLLGQDHPVHTSQGDHGGPSATLFQAIRVPAFWSLAGAFAANAFIFSAMSVHLIPMIVDLGHAAKLAVFLAALIGPMQVAGRLLERGGAQGVSPQVVGKFTFAGLPAALLVLAMFGHQAWAVSLFCVMYGLTNGVLTILRGTLPQALFGSRHYGAIAGAMAGPALLSKAAGPVAVAMLLRMEDAKSILFWGLTGLATGSYVLYIVAIRRGEGLARSAAAGCSTADNDNQLA